MGKLRDIAVAVGLAKTDEQLAAERWVRNFRAASPSAAQREAAQAALRERLTKNKEANHAALVGSTWASLHAAGRFRDERGKEDQNGKQRGDHPARGESVSQVYWPEYAGRGQPRPLKPVY